MASTESVVSLIVQGTNVSRNCEFDATCYPSLKEDLKQFWDAGVAQFATGTNLAVCDEWFHKVYRRHNVSGRHYHTAVHLKEMLEYTNILKQAGVIQESEMYRTMVIATFFHDVVYDPKSNQNEKDSVAEFQEFCQQIEMTTSTSQMIEVLIMATERHKVIPTSDANVSSHQQEMQMATQQLFLDLDMAVLGKEEDAYLAYAALIRKEYAFVPADVYCSKRAMVLQQFLDDSKTIYLSTIFQQSLEQRARNNLQKEIHLLKLGMIPGVTDVE
jgi:predicted metal-dependent HD superfamily phosphohydrolase